MRQINIWGIKINPLSESDIVKLIDKHLSSYSTPFHLTGVNPETIVQSQNNELLRLSINSSDLVNVDNMLVLFFLRLLGNKIPERAASPDIFEQLLRLSNTKGYSIYFLGAKEEIVQLMINKLKIKYPNLKVVGARNGYYKSEEEVSIVRNISELKPNLLFIALPTPQKELFINQYKKQMGVQFAFGVGGAFDVQAGRVIRAPLWMRKIGMEGLHRAFQNPRNYGSRYLKYYLPFIILFLKELIKKKSHRNRN